jgi:hypothetical protein
MSVTARVLVFLIITLGIAGCAVGPRYNLIRDRIPALKAGEGRIFFYMMEDVGDGARFKVNGKKVSLLAWPQSFFFVDRPSGEYKIEACHGFFDVYVWESKLSFTLLGGQTRYVEALGNEFRLILVDPDDAVAAISNCRYAGPELPPPCKGSTSSGK